MILTSAQAFLDRFFDYAVNEKGQSNERQGKNPKNHPIHPTHRLVLIVVSRWDAASISLLMMCESIIDTRKLSIRPQLLPACALSASNEKV